MYRKQQRLGSKSSASEDQASKIDVETNQAWFSSGSHYGFATSRKCSSDTRSSKLSYC